MSRFTKNIVLLVLMLASAVLAPALKATTRMADQRPPIKLDDIIPRQFGEWKELQNTVLQVVNPEQQATIERIYAETLSRTYINPEGYRIMVSVAYGANQSESLALHKPEVCYPAQGFRLLDLERTTVSLEGGSIPATQLRTQFGQRYEPVTYWTVVGDHATHGGSQKKIIEMRYSLLQGVIPDGVLMRFSSIDKDTQKAFDMQRMFARELVAAIAPEHRARFAGTSKSQP